MNRTVLFFGALFTVLVALSLSGRAAAAPESLREFPEVIYCRFTEPFLNIVVDPKAGTLTESSPEGERPPEKGVAVEANSADGRVLNVLVRKGETTVLTLTLDYSGTDGMSDARFPFKAVLSREGKEQHGGAYTDILERLGEIRNEGERKVVDDAVTAITLCYARVWTDSMVEPVTDANVTTRFFAFYSGESVPGESGEGRAALTDEQRDGLRAVLEKTRAVPQNREEQEAALAARLEYAQMLAKALYVHLPAAQ